MLFFQSFFVVCRNNIYTNALTVDHVYPLHAFFIFIVPFSTCFLLHAGTISIKHRRYELYLVSSIHISLQKTYTEQTKRISLFATSSFGLRTVQWRMWESKHLSYEFTADILHIPVIVYVSYALYLYNNYLRGKKRVPMGFAGIHYGESIHNTTHVEW